MDNNSIHYVEIGISGGFATVENFITKFPFHIVAKRCGLGVTQWLVCSRTSLNIRFVFTEVSCPDQVENDPYSVLWCGSRSRPRWSGTQSGRAGDDMNISANLPQPQEGLLFLRDSVFNIALEVKGIQCFAQKLSQDGVEIVKELNTVSDESGQVHLFIIKSVVGNVFHTIIDSQNYHGLFLPGFVAFRDTHSLASCSLENDDDNISHIDHFTFACEVGSSRSIIDWYEKHFYMKRFFINREESESEGFVISGKDIGLRMKALEYWKCAELGLQSNPNCAVQSFKVVIAEALPNQGPNQIDTFLSEHGGPGIQHIGLHTSSMSGTIKKLKLHGVEFAEPPATYYSEVGRLHDILGVGQDVQELKELGILIDTEEEGECSKSPRYLLQKFTKPLFDRDTFFLEIIQRIGATGFGSGNITALWRSVQAYMNEKHHPEKS